MRFKQFILEGINDKYLFKAVLLAGGAGSGKSFVVKKAFGSTGARVINSDDFFEFKLRKYNISMKIAPEGSDLETIQQKHRNRAKELASSKMSHAINGMLPMIIDGTGAKYEKIKKTKEYLEGIGYDVSLVLVNTSLDVSLDRNAKRERSVDPTISKNLWQSVQNNIGKFQSLFGNNFRVVDNSRYLEGKELYEFNLLLAKISRNLIESPLKNKKGQKYIEMVKQVNGKLLSDIED
jgi:dephospho-CoA kinase